MYYLSRYYLKFYKEGTLVRIIKGISSFDKPFKKAELLFEVNGEYKLNIVPNTNSDTWQDISDTDLVKLCDVDGNVWDFKPMFEEQKRENGVLYKSMELDYIKYDLRKKIVKGYYKFVQMSPSIILDKILDGSGFTKGDCDFTDPINITIDWGTVLENLEKLREAVNGYLVFDNDKKVHMKESIGSDNGVRIAYRKNLKFIRRTIDKRSFQNRIYPLGAVENGSRLNIDGYGGYSGYVQDDTSVNKYGVHEGEVKDNGILDIINLVSTPNFDGTYSNGLCENWTKVGNPTLSENTNTIYVRTDYSTKSQKVEASSEGDGVKQSITLITGLRYSLFVWVYLTSGDSQVRVVFGKGGGMSEEAYTTSTGWVQIVFNGFEATGTDGSIEISQRGANAATFYVGAVQMIQNEENKGLDSLVIGDNRERLVELGQRILDQRKDPIVNYEIDTWDLYEHDPDTYGFDKFNLGDMVTIVDPDFDEVKLQVIRKSFDIFEPVFCKVEVGKRKQDFRYFVQSVSNNLRLWL